MNYNGYFTVMGSKKVEPADKTNRTLRFNTNVSNKHNYRQALRKWFIMVNILEKVDMKYEARLKTIGIFIFFSCSKEAHEILTREGINDHI